MIKLAVIGKDVSKSLSPEIHNFIAERTGNRIVYEKLSLLPETFEKRAEELFSIYDGFNVTIPYKLAIMPHLKKIEGDARIFNAVNTVKTCDRSGYNTDGLGFMLMLKSGGIEVDGRDILLLGAGGAGRSVAKKLADAGARVFVYDTRFECSARLEAEFDGVTALKSIQKRRYFAAINATGIGMHATEGVSPIGAEILHECDVAVDLIYTPEKSAFLELAEAGGRKIINGLAMLFYQAYYAQCIFSGRSADEKQAKELFKIYREDIK